MAGVFTSLPTGQLTPRYQLRTLHGESYSINYPADWEIDLSRPSGTDIMLLSPNELAENVFRANVSLTVQNLPNDTITLAAFVERSESQIRTIATNQEIIASNRGVNGSILYHHIVFNQNLGELLLRREQYYIVNSGRAYVITFSAAVANGFRFEEEATEIMRSFRLL